jgi:hypothetical protein
VNTKRSRHESLLVRVCAELGAGRISEGFITDPGFQTDGLTDDASHRITINPAWQTVDTVLHECLHRLYPQWSETYVRNRTAYLRNRLSDAQAQALYAEYQKRVKRLKRTKRIEP